MISIHTVRTWSLVFLFSGIVVFAIGIVAYERPLNALALAVQASLLAFVTTEAFGPIAAQRPRTIRILARVYVGVAVIVLLIFLRSWL